VRPAIFWLHLSAGLVAGLVILLMSATGVLLTYEKQMLAWSDRSAASAPPAADSTRLSVDDLLRSVRAAEPSARITVITMASAPEAPVLVTAGERMLAVNAYTGTVIGEASPRLRRFFRSVTAWHRWFAAEQESTRQTARFFTGWSNFLFLLIVIGGPFLWIPRKWTLAQLRAVTLFRGGLQGKARDFNWHNVIGIWTCVPLFIIVLTALPMSFPWANAAIYQMVGEAPPTLQRPGGEPARRGERGARTAPAGRESLNQAWQRAEQQVDGWQTISLRLAGDPNAPLAFTIDRGTGGQPQLRGTLTVNRASSEVMRWEPFQTQTLGRRLRSYARFAHTGEAFGIVGQTIAGVASAGAVVLVWTGVALALRRFAAWRKRRGEDVVPADARSNAA
jgi:uncharacterized iron-regulated membrane protein